MGIWFRMVGGSMSVCVCVGGGEGGCNEEGYIRISFYIVMLISNRI